MKVAFLTSIRQLYRPATAIITIYLRTYAMALIRAYRSILKVLTDIGFSVLELKKVPAFGWQELHKASILG
ncbi:MAG: hypothetical protein SWX82_03875 [Cyanobacteriota bacterium]|nr:hypothetical protein [Cyanobacteriota bacterium]